MAVERRRLYLSRTPPRHQLPSHRSVPACNPAGKCCRIPPPHSSCWLQPHDRTLRNFGLSRLGRCHSTTGSRRRLETVSGTGPGGNYRPETGPAYRCSRRAAARRAAAGGHRQRWFAWRAARARAVGTCGPWAVYGTVTRACVRDGRDTDTLIDDRDNCFGIDNCLP